MLESVRVRACACLCMLVHACAWVCMRVCMGACLCVVVCGCECLCARMVGFCVLFLSVVFRHDPGPPKTS